MNNKITSINWLKLILGVVLSGMLSACTGVLFQPQRFQFATPDQIGVIYDDIEIQSHDQTGLHGWKLLAKGESHGKVLFFHGNGENISTHFTNVFWLTSHGYDVYLFDYRGYGKSGGIAQIDAVIEDTDAMISYAVSQLDDNEKLIVIGHSMGGSLAIHAVAHSQYKDRIKTLVTVEAFSDYHKITQDVLATSWLTWLLQWPLSLLVDNSYRPLDSVARLSPIPLLLLHSKQDEMISFDHAEALYKVAEEPKQLQIVTGGHNHIFEKNDNRQIVLDYLSAL
ncbi:MAG: lysophospholipase [Gammaproteobacteria bacterium]|nr:lysophospholipase [Gammaproteobacteria bacterium]